MSGDSLKERGLVDRMVKRVMGISVDPKTLYLWHTKGINEVRLNVTSNRRISCTVEDVMKFVYALNDESVPANAKSSPSNCQFHELMAAIYSVTGHTPNKATLWRWETKGLNGSFLKIYRVGKKRVCRLRDVEQFWMDAGRKPNQSEGFPKEMETHC